jgi:hypothetical protein
MYPLFHQRNLYRQIKAMLIKLVLFQRRLDIKYGTTTLNLLFALRNLVITINSAKCAKLQRELLVSDVGGYL